MSIQPKMDADEVQKRVTCDEDGKSWVEIEKSALMSAL